VSVADVLFGRPLASQEEREQRVGPLEGIPLLGLDALSSAAYGPEAALTVLLAVGAAGLRIFTPIAIAVIVLLAIVCFSYRQTIAAYPTGGGSYTVAHENLGPSLGVLAGAALALDYILNVAVGISAGVGAIVSAVPALQPHTLPLCLGVLVLLTVVNLRGVRDAGVVFFAPTYLFVACLLFTFAVGLVKTVLAGGHPAPVVAPPPLPAATATASLWMVLHAFASGCTALTGVEAVSNGVTIFKKPTRKHAKQTLTSIVALLTLLLAGVTFLSRVYHIGATRAGARGYESVLSQVVSAVTGRGVFYYVSIAAIFAVLALSANTSFADFPRLGRVLASDRYVPIAFANRGRRLVFSSGIVVLASLAAILLIAFGGLTERLIPLFAVGAFLAFTLSQAGMVRHWLREGGPGAWRSLLINAVGAAATGSTLVVIVVAKFVDGAWVSILLIVGMVTLFQRVHAHYAVIEAETMKHLPMDATGLADHKPPVVVVPIGR
jgi:amino acid transporter